MTLLEPAHALLAGALAVPTLLLLYMLKLRRRPVRVSSAMFWAEAAKDLEANTPLRWLRASWLLIMQLLAVLLLVTALGRPAIESAEPSVDRLVLMLDRTASTGARDGETTTFEKLRTRLLDRIEALDRAGFSGEASLVLLDAAPALAAGPTRDLREIASALREVEQTDQSGDLVAALRLAETIAAGPEQAVGAEAGVLTGMIELATDGSLAGVVPAGVRVLRESLQAPSGNAGIVAMAARRDIDEPSLARILVSIVCDAAEPITLAVEFAVDGRAVATRPLRLEPDASTPGVVRGTLTESLRLPFGGLVVARLMRPDALDSDNAAGVRVAAPPAPSIVLVQPSRDDLESDASWVLIETLRAIGPASLQQMTQQEAAELGIPQGTQLVILDGVAPGTIAIPPTKARLSFGVDPGLPGLSTGIADRSTGRFVTWDRNHPVWRGAAIDSVRWSQSVPFNELDGSIQQLAMSGQGPVAVLEERGGVRKLALSFRPADSTWTTHYSFALFLANAVELLTWTASTQAGTVLTTGLSPSLSPAEVAPITPSSVVLSDGSTRAISASSNGMWPLGLIARAGPVTLSGKAGEKLALYAGVLNEDETRLTRERPETNRQTDSSQRPSAGSDDEPSRQATRETTREVWYWFVIPASLLLAIEWFVYARRARV